MIAALEIVELPPERQACRLCGARRRRGEADDEWIIDVERDWRRHEVRRVRDDHDDERYEADERPWTRRHRACEPTATAVVEAVTGVALDDEETAREVLRRHGVSLLAGDRQATVRRPCGRPGRT